MSYLKSEEILLAIDNKETMDLEIHKTLPLHISDNAKIINVIEKTEERRNNIYLSIVVYYEVEHPYMRLEYQ